MIDGQDRARYTASFLPPEKLAALSENTVETANSGGENGDKLRQSGRQKAVGGAVWVRRHNRTPFVSPIVPRDDIHGFALMVVIAIMSFLAAWMVFAAHFIGESARAWSSSMAREAVIQIMPVPGQDSTAAQQHAAEIAESFGGIASVHSVSIEETRNLLAPWLGVKADIAALPVPRLVILRLKPDNRPDFKGLNAALQQNIRGVRFDEQQVWASKLTQGANIMLGGVLFLLFLVLAAMVITIIFATRSALNGNIHIIEVLHFIGADDRFVAHHFDVHFFRTGLRGAMLGGIAAGLLFALLFVWMKAYRVTPEGSQMAALFGQLIPDWFILLEICLLIFGIALLTMATSHCTIMRRLYMLDEKTISFFSDIS